MTDLTKQLEALVLRINASEPITRFQYHGQLHQLINKMELHGIPVKNRTRQLDEELQNDAIEAQFDNMPV